MIITITFIAYKISYNFKCYIIITVYFAIDNANAMAS